MGRALDPEWKAIFLKAYCDSGTRWTAARRAGVSEPTVARWEERDPEFAAAVEHARQEHADFLEGNMKRLAVEKHNVVANIVLLKKHRPQDFVERRQELHLHAHAVISDEAARELLAGMLADATDATKAMLAAHVPHAAPQVTESAPAEQARILSENPSESSAGLEAEPSQDA